MSLYINKLRSLLELRKVNHKDLADKIGMSPTGFSQMLSNDSLKVSVLQSIADYLKVPMTYFFESDNGLPPHVDVDRVFDVMREIVKREMK